MVEGPDGKPMMKIYIPPSPPPKVRPPAVKIPFSGKTAFGATLSGVPAFTWTYGCAATSAGLIFGYYDRNDYPNMYTGSVNGGICPLDNSAWGGGGGGEGGDGECSFVASHQGIPDCTEMGHVDDFWTGYGDSGDPYYGNWTPHAATPAGEGDCTADFMGTNQWYPGDNQSTDGGTWLSLYPDGSETRVSTWGYGSYGMKLYAEWRGYTVEDYYNQYIYGYGGLTSGFTFQQYMDEIDAGRPVMILVVGHAMVGVGYEESSQTVYLHDTWDYDQHQMTWGGSYSGMEHMAVTVFKLSGGTPPTTATLTMAASPSAGGATSPSGSSSQQTGTPIAISASPASGYSFDRWGVSGSGSVASSSSADTTVTLTGDATVTAYFSTAGLTLTVTAYPSNAGSTTPSGTKAVSSGVPVDISATPNTGHSFEYWASSGGASVADPNSADTTVTLTSDGAVTAHFSNAPRLVDLTLSASPTEGGGTNPSGTTQVYTDATTSISATANSGYTFINWQVVGDAEINNAFSASTTVVLNSATDIIAIFADNESLATMKIEPSSSVGGITEPSGTLNAMQGASYNISAFTNPGYKFMGWRVSGSARVADETAVRTRVFVNGDAAIIAEFADWSNIATLTMSADPVAGGSTDPSIGEHYVNKDTDYTITAAAETGYRFSAWTADGGATIADAESISTTARLSGDAEITANFVKTAVLTMAASPSDGGVTVPAAGSSTVVDAGVVYDIVATPAEGMRFSRWSISGSGGFGNYSSANTTVTLTGDSTVTAYFSAPYQVTVGSLFSIDLSEFPSLANLDKKPKVYAMVGTKKRKSKVLNSRSGFKRGAVSSLDCQWKDRRSHAGTYNLYVQPKGRGIEPTLVSSLFQIMPPTITGIDPVSGATGQPVSVTGQFFGSKPKAWFVIKETGRKKRVRGAVMTVGDDDVFSFTIPRGIDIGVECDFVIDSGVGQDSVGFNAD